MNLSELPLDEVDAAAIAGTLIRKFGESARALVDEQVAHCVGHPEIAGRWNAIAHAITVMEKANAHMEAALKMLDGIEEQNASIHLDRAIVALGFRPGLSLDDCPGRPIVDPEAPERGPRPQC